MIRTDAYVGLALMPCVFLYFRSIELALKAVLVHHGVIEQEITREMGHRITALMLCAETLTPLGTIGIMLEDRQLLDRFSEDYADKSFEYSDNFWNYPNLENLENLCVRVCAAVRHRS